MGQTMLIQNIAEIFEVDQLDEGKHCLSQYFGIRPVGLKRL